jgi:hypothetical protein
MHIRSLLLCRVLAYVIDCALLFVVLAPLGFVVGHVLDFAPSTSRSIYLTLLLNFSLPGWAYFIWGDRSAGGATLGKHLLALETRTTAGERLGIGCAIGRTAVKMLPWEIAHAAAFLLAPAPGAFALPSWIGFGLSYALVLAYVVTAWWTKGRRSVHDIVAGTSIWQPARRSRGRRDARLRAPATGPRITDASGSQIERRAWEIAVAAAFSAVMVALGALALAPLVGVVFATGFFGGFLLWLAGPRHASFATIKVPYIFALVAYVIHRTDEELSGFVAAMEELTGHQAVAVVSPVSIALVAFSLAWMVSPLLLRRGHALGHFGVWTLFTGFGVIELWHFVFPLLTPEPYGYFPGMITAPLIAAVGWWGMWRLWRAKGPTTRPDVFASAPSRAGTQRGLTALRNNSTMPLSSEVVGGWR